MLVLCELQLSLLNACVFVKYSAYSWVPGKAFHIHQSSAYAVKMLGSCELHLGLLNSWVALWSTGHMAELIGRHFKSSKVLFTLWRCWGCVTNTFACWVQGGALCSTGDVAELMGKHFKSIRVLSTLWRCTSFVNYTLACWVHGMLCEVQGMWLNSWESITNPSEFCLRCEDVGALWTTP